MSNKTILTLILIALFFWAITGLKGISGFNPSDAQLQQIDWSKADVRPYQRGNLENDPEENEDSVKGIRLSKASNFTNDEIGAGETKTANPVVAQAKTKDKKKKKKKKKVAKPKSGSPFGRDIAKNNTVPKNGFAPTEFNPAPGASQVPAAEPENEEEKSFEYWMKLLLARPDKVLVNRFVREFQSNQISANVFYAVLEMMLKEDNEEFKELAVRAAGAMSSLQSFDFLIMALKDSSRVATNNAQAELLQYSQPIGLPVLHGVISVRSGDQLSLDYALQALDSATAKYISGSNEDGESTYSYERLFRSFIAPLKKIVATHGQDNLGSMARRSLERIESMRQVVADLDENTFPR